MRRALSFFAAVVLTLSLLSCARTEAKREGTTPSPPFVFAKKPASPISFLSTQLNPVEEEAKMKTVILKDFPGEVDFLPNDNSFIATRIAAIRRDGSSRSILIGALHGDLSALREGGLLRPLDEVYAGLEGRTFFPNLIGLSRLADGKSYYIPWMQATFVMVANRKALPYLPAGARLESLTYDQLLQWAKAIEDKTGMKALGFPAGTKGLIHRFFEGYLYPSFTGSTVVKFRSPEAERMWAYFRNLWIYANPGSLSYSTMAEPLLTGDVWIAWDHTARLMKAFSERPKDFVAFPAPRGPKGLGFMTVVSGLAVPAGVEDPASAEILIDYLTRPEIQRRTLVETGFFPVVTDSGPGSLPESLGELHRAVEAQTKAQDAVLTLLPVGLGKSAGDFDALYTLTFSDIVLGGKDIRSVLDGHAEELQAILDRQKARCWPPDHTADGNCVIE